MILLKRVFCQLSPMQEHAFVSSSYLHCTSLAFFPTVPATCEERHQAPVAYQNDEENETCEIELGMVVDGRLGWIVIIDVMSCIPVLPV